jgi:hypothetical protein
MSSPARLVVPGFCGTIRVKWLTQMTFAGTRVTRPFTTRWYNDPVPDAAGGDSGKTVPVWSVAPESVIVSPAPAQPLKRDTPQEIWGWAWADREIDRVEVSVDGGAATAGDRRVQSRVRPAGRGRGHPLTSYPPLRFPSVSVPRAGENPSAAPAHGGGPECDPAGRVVAGYAPGENPLFAVCRSAGGSGIASPRAGIRHQYQFCRGLTRDPCHTRYPHALVPPIDCREVRR